MMKFSKEFFDLQLRFAERVAELSGLPLEQTLLDYPNLYVRFGLGRTFDPQHPVWRDFLEGFARTEDRADWTWRFFQSREPYPAPSTMVATFGCFSYALAPNGYIRLHFENIDPDVQSPLSLARRETRLAELRALFDHVKHTQPDVTHAAGVSWLYNLPAYRRLFPETYLATTRIAEGRFRNMPLWGQFLNRRGDVMVDSVGLFLKRLSNQNSLEYLAQCFPFLPLAVEASTFDFHKFHGI